MTWRRAVQGRALGRTLSCVQHISATVLHATARKTVLQKASAVAACCHSGCTACPTARPAAHLHPPHRALAPLYRIRAARSAAEARGASPSRRPETPTLVVECAALDWRGADADIAPDRASRAEQVGPNSERIGAKLAWSERPKVGPPYIRLCILLDRGLRSESRCIPVWQECRPRG